MVQFAVSKVRMNAECRSCMMEKMQNSKATNVWQFIIVKLSEDQHQITYNVRGEWNSVIQYDTVIGLCEMVNFVTHVCRTATDLELNVMISHVPKTVHSECSVWMPHVAIVMVRPNRRAAPCFTGGPVMQQTNRLVHCRS